MTSVIPGEEIKADPKVWPGTARWRPDGLGVGGLPLRTVAEEFGTPAYVLDEQDFVARCRWWRDALPDGDVHYAGKAFLCPEVVRWVDELGLSLDVCTGGELAVAAAGGLPAHRMVVHGNNKSTAELARAVRWGVGCVVVDSFTEIERLAGAAAEAGVRQAVMVRVTPGVRADTHDHIATGVEDQKFGFSLAAGAAAEAVRRVIEAPPLEFTGLHSHIGSQIRDVGSPAAAARALVGLAARIERVHRTPVPRLDLGGGLAIAYREADPAPPTPAELVAALRDALTDAAADTGLRQLPRLAVEPGRSIAGPSAVTVYEVGTVKEIPGARTYVSVDGGMSDNLRPSMYGADYTAVLASRVSQAPTRPVTVCGKHCESGDVLVRDLPLPADLRPGDLLAVPASGAYHRSMAGNYNHVLRPPVVAVRDGAARIIVRRETEEDLLGLYPA